MHRLLLMLHLERFEPQLKEALEALEALDLLDSNPRLPVEVQLGQIRTLIDIGTKFSLQKAFKEQVLVDP